CCRPTPQRRTANSKCGLNTSARVRLKDDEVICRTELGGRYAPRLAGITLRVHRYHAEVRSSLHPTGSCRTGRAATYHGRARAQTRWHQQWEVNMHVFRAEAARLLLFKCCRSIPSIPKIGTAGQK